MDTKDLKLKQENTMSNLKVNLCGIELDNPVIPASGTFGFGYEFAEIYDINCLGTFSFKGTTLEPRYGNPLPRIAECNDGLINSIGLQNPGVDKVIEEELPKMKECFNKKVVANIGGFSLDEYKKCAEAMDKVDQVGIIEVNISCPNVHGGGMSFGTSPEAVAEVVKAVKKVTTKPVIIKLSPNVTDIVEIAKACEAGAEMAYKAVTVPKEGTILTYENEVYKKDEVLEQQRRTSIQSKFDRLRKKKMDNN